MTNINDAERPDMPDVQATSLPEGTLIVIRKDDNQRNYVAFDHLGNQLKVGQGGDVESYQAKNAFKKGMALKAVQAKNGMQLRLVSMEEYTAKAHEQVKRSESKELSHAELIKFIENSPAIKPRSYKVNDLLWRFMIRSVLRAKNLMFTGPQGCGKTTGVFALAEVLKRPLFNIPLGASQDPRSTLIGNLHFKHGEGTYVADSEFVKGIQTPNAIILLDELTRAHPDAMNILMSVLDPKQRFLRIDEKPDTPIIHVAPGVTFMATANIGHQFTGTRTLDAALKDRFEIIEVQPLSKDGEIDLLTDIFPSVDKNEIAAIATIAEQTRKEVKTDGGKLTTLISTRQTIRLTELVHDGFTLAEAADLVIYPFYSDAGGADSERSFVGKLVQAQLPNKYDSKKGPYGFDTKTTKAPWDA